MRDGMVSTIENDRHDNDLSQMNLKTSLTPEVTQVEADASEYLMNQPVNLRRNAANAD